MDIIFFVLFTLKFQKRNTLRGAVGKWIILKKPHYDAIPFSFSGGRRVMVIIEQNRKISLLRLKQLCQVRGCSTNEGKVLGVVRWSPEVDKTEGCSRIELGGSIEKVLLREANRAKCDGDWNGMKGKQKADTSLTP